MKTLVVLPMGAHPFHPGHLALYQSAQRTFPDAEVFVAATNDTAARPFPFAVKEKLAKLAGVEPGHFVQVKSPFRAQEITSRFDPSQDILIFVRSEKDQDSQPQPGGVKRDGSPGYLQPLLGAERLEPFEKHAYMAYLPTVEFGPGLRSATEIRKAWPKLSARRKTALVMSLYPRTQENARLADTVVQLLDAAIGTVTENQGWAATYNEENRAGHGQQGAGMTATWQRKHNQPIDERKKKEPGDPAEYVRDPELYKLRHFAQQHYSQFSDDPEMAMMKWLQRGLQHSEENDIEHSQRLAQLSREIQKIKNQLRQQQNADYVDEAWSEKYKRSINCDRPRGFSQRAHCAGRNK